MRRRAATNTWFAVAAMLFAPSAAAQAPGFGGVTLKSNYFELVKRAGEFDRSVIHPDETPDEDDRAQQDSQAATGMEVIAGPLAAFFAEVMGPRSPYPLLKDSILSYAYLRPMDQCPDQGRMYIMYVGELYWPFPAPLFADMVRIRVVYHLSPPARDLLTVALGRFGKEHIETPPEDAKEMPRLKVQELLENLQDPELTLIRWRRDQTIRELNRRTLTPAEVGALREIARGEVTAARVAALQVLGRGGLVRDVAFYASLLTDPAPEVQQAAFWALLFMGDAAGLAKIRDHAGLAAIVGARLRETNPALNDEQLADEVTAFVATLRAVTPP
ncbi:MAG: hypothetical protein HY903_06860 [Deltaproteobacteria bacterium]|nr:hypothetical protein [Deltaproteobacteria bacterium]